MNTDEHLVKVMVHLGPVSGQFLLVVSVQEAMIYVCRPPPVPDQFLVVVAVEKACHLAAQLCGN